ncbi:hypothetical protein [Terrisporobacter sp.]|uniref:hypothetical protein n=1 Tax=Terrisporobacter sp. TaxID=1965305 RepID=UPI0026279F78|nr:hypothetical protein [Terrisporobacter sp.]
MKGKRNRSSDSNDFILFLYILFTVIVLIVWLYQIFVSEQYAIGMLLLFWQVVFTIAYFIFVKN